jgi:2-polyprenyl-6-methoxyphenol hydroxylase-like FAD-dependent oxidoreductase
MLATAGYTRGVPVPGRPGSVHMIYGKRSFFGYYPHPDGEVWWFANPPAPVREDGDRLRATPVAEWRRRVADLFRLDESPARALVLGAEEVFPGWHTYHLPTVPVWHRGRMIVIGDAVHAVTAAGQGAAMAMEDAVALAKCLRDIEDVPTAFGVFEDVRRKRVERIVAEGLRNGGDKTAGRSARMLRDERLRRAFRELAASGEDPLRPLWDHHIEWDERVRG